MRASTRAGCCGPGARPGAALITAFRRQQPRREKALAAAQVEYVRASLQEPQFEDGAVDGVGAQLGAREMIGKRPALRYGSQAASSKGRTGVPRTCRRLSGELPAYFCSSSG